MTHASDRHRADPAPASGAVDAVAHPFDTALVPVDYPSVADLVDRRAAAAPDAVAVRWAHGEVTYRVLAAAARTAGREPRPGERIGIWGGKSPATVAALLGALGSGAVAMPVDQALPLRRFESMIGAAGVHRVLLTRPDVAAETPAGVELIRLSFDGLVAHADPAATPSRARPGPDDPAYIFFTSGTTGRAKAVLGRHRGLNHFVAWEIAEFGVRPGDRVAQLTTLSFDAVLRDVFVPLASGATLCLPAPADLDDTGRTVDWLARENVTVVHTTPSVADAWLRGADRDRERLSRLRLLCLAGEPLHGTLVTRLRERLLGPDTEIVNFYGSTETTMIKTFHRVSRDQGPGPVPIGRALPGCQAVVLDEADRACGPGGRGEIVLRTPYRTLGYLDEAGADGAFQPNPRSSDPGDLIYRAGDLATVGTDGGIRVEGRSDDLLKVRGFRVHPAEVAADLATHPEVQRVHVAVDEDVGDALVAYVVRVRGSALTAEALRAHARTQLPLALVPGLFHFVDGFTLLPNGKLDRASLPARTARPTVERIAPRGETEQLIWQIWSDLLGHADFGVTDDFFAVGGHSLLATIMLSRLRTSTGVSLPLRKLLEGPRVEHLAEMLRSPAAAGEQTGDVLLPLHPGASSGPLLFVVHPIGGDVLCFRELAAALSPDFTVIGVRSPGLQTGTAFRTVQDMAIAYVHEVRKAQPPDQDAYHLAGWSMGGVIAYEMARQLSFVGERTASVTLLDSYAPGAGAFDDLADPATDRVRAFAGDLKGLTGERLDTAPLYAGLAGDPPEGDEEFQSLQRRYRVFDANATALAHYRLRRARFRDTRFTLLLAADQGRPDGCTPTLGWTEALGVDVPTVSVPDADHFTLLQGAAVRTVAEAMVRAVPREYPKTCRIDAV